MRCRLRQFRLQVLRQKKIEIKSARYRVGKDDCVWQHLEPDHDYEYAMFTLLDFHGWKVWGIKKTLLMGEMREKKIVTFQGKQGWWVKITLGQNFYDNSHTDYFTISLYSSATQKR